MAEIKVKKKDKLLKDETLFVGLSYVDNKGKISYGIFHRDTIKGLKKVSYGQLTPCIFGLNQEEARTQKKIYNQEAREAVDKNIKIGRLKNGENQPFTSPIEIIKSLIESEFSERNWSLKPEQVLHEVLNVMHFIDDIDNVVYEEEWHAPLNLRKESIKQDVFEILCVFIMAVKEFEITNNFKFYEPLIDSMQMNTLKISYFVDDYLDYLDDVDESLFLKVYVRFVDKNTLSKFMKILKKHFVGVKATSKPKLDKESYYYGRTSMEPFTPLSRLITDDEDTSDGEWEDD